MDLIESPSAATRRHPWEVSRFGFFARILENTLTSTAPITVLDAGAGDGWFATNLISRLPNGSSIICLDINYTPDHLATLRDNAPPGVSFTTTRPQGLFDIVLALDVVEHIEEDLSFLQSVVVDNLNDSGHLIFSVPAWPALFSNHDRLLQHHRRYSPATARALLNAAGLCTTSSGGLFHGPVFVRALQVMIERCLRQKPGGEPDTVWRQGLLVTLLTGYCLGADNALSRAATFAELELPGLSWWASCQKRT